MANFLGMLFAIAVLCAAALCFHTFLKINMGEGMVLSAFFVVVSLFAGSLAGTFAYGMAAIYFVAFIGVISWVMLSVRVHRLELLSVASVSVTILVFLYLSCMILYHNDFIQHIDEFHEWAAAVRYMVQMNRLPVRYDFIGGGGQYAFATSLFHLFFQRITGYSEQNMYVSAVLLTWIGLMLPFSGYEWKNWKKPVIYAAIMYFALYTLYLYGTKNLYVDMPVAAWAGGLAGWWVNREKRKSNWPVLIAGLVMLHFSKASVGLLMVFLVICFVLLQSFVVGKGSLNLRQGVRRLAMWFCILCGIVVLCSVVLITFSVSVQPYKASADVMTVDGEASDTLQRWSVAGHILPDSISDRINSVGLSKEKTFLSFGEFAASAVGRPMASKSNWNLAFLPFLFAMLVLMKACGELYNQKNVCAGYMLYMIFAALCYLAALFFSYLFMFAYELSLEMRSINRYFSICAVYLFVIVLTVLLQPVEVRQEKAREYLTYGLLFFFLLGLNKKYIPNNTALQKTEINGYSKIADIKKQVEKIDDIIGITDRIYFIHQFESDSLGEAELINAPALYYLDYHLSNYLGMPWRFFEGGCNIRLENYNTLSLEDLPMLLEQDGYAYVWIYTSDRYLEEKLPQILNCETVEDKSLYQVRYENGKAVGLDFMCGLKG